MKLKDGVRLFEVYYSYNVVGGGKFRRNGSITVAAESLLNAAIFAEQEIPTIVDKLSVLDLQQIVARSNSKIHLSPEVIA